MANDAHVLEDLLMDTTVALIAAISLLKNSPKTGAASDRIFDKMVEDYEGKAAAAITYLRGTP